MTAPDPTTELAAVLRRSGRAVLATWLLAAAAWIAAAAVTLPGHGNGTARALATALDLDRPVTTPSGTSLRHPQTLRPGVRPEHVPAAPGVFDPAHGASR